MHARLGTDIKRLSTTHRKLQMTPKVHKFPFNVKSLKIAQSQILSLLPYFSQGTHPWPRH